MLMTTTGTVTQCTRHVREWQPWAALRLALITRPSSKAVLSNITQLHFFKKTPTSFGFSSLTFAWLALYHKFLPFTHQSRTTMHIVNSETFLTIIFMVSDRLT